MPYFPDQPGYIDDGLSDGPGLGPDFDLERAAAMAAGVSPLAFQNFQNTWYQIVGDWEGFPLAAHRFANSGQGNAFDWVRNNYEGIRDVSRRQLRAEEVVSEDNDNEDCGCGTPDDMGYKDMNRNHAKTYIPEKFRMRHHRVGSGAHVAIFGTSNKIVLTFARKQSCNTFCRMWNQMMAAVGQASPFIPADIIQVFSDMIIGGSGRFGIENNFSPPFQGRIDVA